MGRALLVDATSVFAFQQYLKEHDYPVQGNIHYGALLNALNQRIAPGAQSRTPAAHSAAAHRPR